MSTNSRLQAKLVFPTLPTYKPIVLSARLPQVEFSHKMAEIELWSERSGQSQFATGTPIRFTYGYTPNALTYYGYVLWVRPTSQIIKRRHVLRMVCIGTTWLLKQVNTRVYSDTTIETVVQGLLASHKLNSVVAAPTTVWPSVTNPGLSDWTFFQRQAERIGYTLFVVNGQVHFHDPVVYLKSNFGTWPVLNWEPATGVNISIMDLSLSIGTDESGGQKYRRHQLVSLDSTTGAVSHTVENFERTGLASQVSVPKFSENIQDFAADTSTERQALVDGAGLSARWNQTGTLKVIGNPRIFAGGGVILRKYDAFADGLWYVHRCDNELELEKTPNSFTQTLTLYRDSQARGDTPAIPVRPVAGTQNGVFVPVLVNNVWVYRPVRSQVLAA